MTLKKEDLVLLRCFVSTWLSIASSGYILQVFLNKAGNASLTAEDVNSVLHYIVSN